MLGKRLDRLGWEHRTLAGPVPVEQIVAMRLSALIVDLDGLRAAAWEELERLCERAARASASSSAPGARPSPSACAGCAWAPTTGSTKPCHPEELIARVEAVVRRRRRTESRQDAEPVQAGELEIRSDRFQAFVAGRSIDLTRREFELIELLAEAGGRVLEREEIYQRVWGYAMARGDRSVDVFVRKLRQKLEKASPDWRYIHTHFGVGYRFAAEPVEGPIEVPDAPPADLLPAAEPAAERAGARVRFLRDHRAQRRDRRRRSPRRSPSCPAAGTSPPSSRARCRSRSRRVIAWAGWWAYRRYALDLDALPHGLPRAAVRGDRRRRARGRRVGQADRDDVGQPASSS